MIRIQEYLPVNTGELVTVRRIGERTLVLTPVQASAASHVLPRYEFSGEAPRIYGEFNSSDIKETWIHWIVQRIDPEQAFEDTRDARDFIEKHIDQIPSKGQRLS